MLSFQCWTINDINPLGDCETQLLVQYVKESHKKERHDALFHQILGERAENVQNRKSCEFLMHFSSAGIFLSRSFQCTYTVYAVDDLHFNNL